MQGVSVWVAVGLFMAMQSFAGCHVSGAACQHLDINARYAAAMYGLTNGLSTVLEAGGIAGKPHSSLALWIPLCCLDCSMSASLGQKMHLFDVCYFKLQGLGTYWKPGIPGACCLLWWLGCIYLAASCTYASLTARPASRMPQGVIMTRWRCDIGVMAHSIAVSEPICLHDVSCHARLP
jgi:hypothetical protein